MATMMWITQLIITLVCFPGTQALDFCQDVVSECRLAGGPWTRCYEDRIATCTLPRGKLQEGFIRMLVNSSLETGGRLSIEHAVHIPSTALQRSRGAVSSSSEGDVLVIISVLNSTLFQLRQSPRSRGRSLIPDQSSHRQRTVLGQSVLAVRVGNHAVSNLSQPIRLTFTHNQQAEDGICVFWQESEEEDGTGDWREEGCETSYNEREFICSCNHLSFFAVLVNPRVSVARVDAVTLSYINYIGSALSVIFTVISLVIYTCLQRSRPEKSIGVHMQLTGALFCLHLSYLLGGAWVWLELKDEDGWGCRVLGLLLHWSLLATFSWTALEGFHLYLLLVRVFNIYIRRYLLKLSLVGWGVPIAIAVVCGALDIYGKYSIPVNDADSNASAVEMCWISNDVTIAGSAKRQALVVYITVVGYLGVVLLFNTAMLGVVVVKLWRLRDNTQGASGGREGSGGWKKMYRERRAHLWKDCAMVLGLSCVLGLPWGLACTTYSLFTPVGLYLFTILNALQGVFVFLWSLALTCKSQAYTSTTTTTNLSAKDPSTQKMMETSFNNSH